MTTQRITKRTVDGLRAKGTEWTLWDNAVTGFGIRVRPTGAKSYVVIYRAGAGRGAPMRRSKFDDLVDSVIPPEIWSMLGIDWLTNTLTANGYCYCDISMSVEVLMRLFPGTRIPVLGAEFVGNCLLVKEDAADNVVPQPRKALGRPPRFPWESFHVEVADLIKSGRMPEKKEAAIQHMIGWFASLNEGQLPSRSAVSEKLTPYYRRFFSGLN
jgi:hypothetical protein